MTKFNLNTLYDVNGQVVVITGAGGVLCGTIASALAEAGLQVVLLDRNKDRILQRASEIHSTDGKAISNTCDMTDKAGLQEACDQVVQQFGRVDILINGAGGNKPGAITSKEQSFFDLDQNALERVFDDNFTSTLLSCQVFGKVMAEQKKGVILNIASMSSLKPLTHVPAYNAAKAAVANFTQWLAVYVAQEYSPNIRVNAIAPGFFITRFNRYLLIDRESGQYTQRGQAVIAHTPMGRLGVPKDLLGAVLWLISPASAFVTGIVVPVDGGFSAFSGV